MKLVKKGLSVLIRSRLRRTTQLPCKQIHMAYTLHNIIRAQNIHRNINYCPQRVYFNQLYLENSVLN